jgi:hypothetical protein
MLSDAGSIASIASLPVSAIALIFAIYQIIKLRGETRAARDAAEEARRLIKRETTSTDLTRLNERIQGLIDLYRTGERHRALERFAAIINLFIEIRRSHPNLSQDHRSQIQESITILRSMQGELETLETEITPDIRGKSNDALTRLQTTLLIELEDLLE